MSDSDDSISNNNASTNQTRPTPPSDKLRSKLNDLIRNRLWDRVTARIQKNRRVRFIEGEEDKENSSYDFPKEIDFIDVLAGNTLHLATMFQAPSHIIKEIIEARPTAVKETNLEGLLPLHLACMPKDMDSGKHLGIDENMMRTFEIIYEADRSALFDSSIGTPLHLVCEHKPPLSLVNRILDLSGGQRFECKKDIESQIPLHVAIDYHASYQVIEKLIQIYPKGVKTRRSKGYLPIHCAAVSGCTHRVLVLLLKKHPEGMEKSDEDLDTPLHLVFSDDDYKEKWTCDGDGESRQGDVLDVKQMVYSMLKYYAIEMKQKKGVAKGNLAVKQLLNKRNANKMKVIDVAKICKKICDVPNELIEYLKKLASGKIVVDTEDEVTVKQEEGKDDEVDVDQDEGQNEVDMNQEEEQNEVAVNLEEGQNEVAVNLEEGQHEVVVKQEEGHEEMSKEKTIEWISAQRTKKRKAVSSPENNKEEKRHRRENTEEGNEFEFDTEEEEEEEEEHIEQPETQPLPKIKQEETSRRIWHDDNPYELPPNV